MNQAASTRFRDVSSNGRSAPMQNVQKWGALIGGSALALLGLTRRSKAGLALAAAGGALAYAGTRVEAGPRELVARSSIVVNCSREEAFRFWRNFENFPLFMRHLESVTQTGNRRSRWIALGPMGYRVTWDAEIVAERDNELISWRSLAGSEIDVDGFVEFTRATGDRGTLVNVTIIYSPPAGGIGHAVAKMFGKDPNFLMRQDLRRFKALIETGEIPTTEGQSHGPRSATTAAARLINPDMPIRGEGTKVTEVLEARRRAS
ncbi:MAG TPA: SRPBCC family protein [Candidatus Angelobacter sp.]|nr:SRPBCC family protein [Candidatus Angelobacter sp.]